jgi:uncharacterized repeat protein (TIGR03806 family)
MICRFPTRGVSVLLLAALFTGTLSVSGAPAEDEAPFGLDHRSPWTTSHVLGSPDPPLPCTVEKTFTNIHWRAPMFVIAEPDTDSLLVIQQGGEKERPSKIMRLHDDPATDQIETLLTITNRLIYSVEFHPGYRTNGHLFLFSNGPTPRGERTNRISRVTVSRDAARQCDPDSEKSIIEWRSAGHDGGGIVFGHDGMLYITTGDGTSDSDGWNSGQTLDDLLGGVLRIDVDHPAGDQAYSVPKDNPFVGWTNARPEIWAYGLRNPWRMSVDKKTGHIWVGNNGQDLWETAHLIRRGENYGWSVYEGSHPFYLNRKLGPTPLVPPTIEHHHAEARSLTGGVVYYGELLPDLEGVYIYGDYSTGTIWGARHNGSRMTWHKELARTELQIAAFGVSHRGELLIVDHGGGIYRLVKVPPPKIVHQFPTRLSETGIFLSTKDHRVDPGLIPYSVNTPGWVDGARVERFVGLPGDSKIELSNGWTFPNGGVLMQTLSLPDPRVPGAAANSGSAGALRRVETRILTRQTGQWVGYSYRWDDSQTDATLVPAAGEDRDLSVGSDADPAWKPDRKVPSASAHQTWHYPARSECMACHSRAANFVLGFTELQLNKDQDYGAVRDNQLRTLPHVGLFNKSKLSRPATNLADAYDSNGDLEARARSWLHVNCSVCHVEAGGGNAKMELGFTTKPQKMNIVEARPQHDTFGIANAMIIAPGDPERSILYQRVSRRGRGQMPPLVSTVVDREAVALIRDWIRSMKPAQQFVRDWKMEDLLPSLERAKHSRSFESGKAAFRQTGCNQCHEFAGEGGSVGPDLSGVSKRLSPRELLESMVLPSKVIAEGYATSEIETKSGDVIAGRIESENERDVVIRPVAAEAPITIRKSEIRQRALSKISNMPAGILNTLDEAQILDLLAYLLSDSNPDDPVFLSSGAKSPQ